MHNILAWLESPEFKSFDFFFYKTDNKWHRHPKTAQDKTNQRNTPTSQVTQFRCSTSWPTFYSSMNQSVILLGHSPPSMSQSIILLGHSPPSMGQSVILLGHSPPSMGQSIILLGHSPPSIGQSVILLWHSHLSMGQYVILLGHSPPLWVSLLYY